MQQLELPLRQPVIPTAVDASLPSPVMGAEIVDYGIVPARVFGIELFYW